MVRVMERWITRRCGIGRALTRHLLVDQRPTKYVVRCGTYAFMSYHSLITFSLEYVPLSLPSFRFHLPIFKRHPLPLHHNRMLPYLRHAVSTNAAGRQRSRDGARNERVECWGRPTHGPVFAGHGLRVQPEWLSSHAKKG